MSSKPLRNGKGVNKPFRSPFANLKKDLPSNFTDSSTSKQLFLEEASPSKQLKLSETTIAGNSNVQDDAPSMQDLEELERRVKEKEKSVSDLKRRLVLRRKHNPDDLKADIEKWTLACQEALQDYQQEVQSKSDEPVNMSKILSHLGIPDHIVRYSKDDEIFH